MKELNGRKDNEPNSLLEGGGRQEQKRRLELVRHEEKQKLETQERRVLSQLSTREQRDKREEAHKIHDIKMELFSIAEEQAGGKVVSDQQVTNLIKEKPPTLMEQFKDGLKKLKEWLARRRREKLTIQLRELQNKQAELIPVQLVEKKEVKSLPVYTLGE
jgi:hypothetical protein